MHSVVCTFYTITQLLAGIVIAYKGKKARRWFLVALHEFVCIMWVTSSSAELHTVYTTCPWTSLKSSVRGGASDAVGREIGVCASSCLQFPPGRDQNYDLTCKLRLWNKKDAHKIRKLDSRGPSHQAWRIYIHIFLIMVENVVTKAFGFVLIVTAYMAFSGKMSSYIWFDLFLWLGFLC